MVQRPDQERRLALQTRLQEIMGDNKVYFQPPNGMELTYPCIVYNLDNEKVDYADDFRYKSNKRYQITIIDRDPVTRYFEPVAYMPLTAFERFFALDDLNHFVFNTYI